MEICYRIKVLRPYLLTIDEMGLGFAFWLDNYALMYLRYPICSSLNDFNVL